MKKFRETDQDFIVGAFNVYFYADAYKGENADYYGCELIKFNGNAVVKRVWLYFRKESETTYRKIWERLHDESLLEKLINKREYSRVTEREVAANEN